MFIIPGQAASLHGLSSFESSIVHLIPPYHACRVGSRVRLCDPPPHALSHFSHSPQSEYSQFTIENEKDYISGMKI